MFEFLGGSGPMAGFAVREPDLLGLAGRRDLSDLNRRYLELGLVPEHADDPLFGWSGAVTQEIGATDEATRARMAECPFALVEVCLPPVVTGSRVGDGGAGAGTGQAVAGLPRPAACVAYARMAVFTAWRIAASAPLAARFAFGCPAKDEPPLLALSPSQVAGWADDPGTVRARWPGEPHFWAMLRHAAEADDPPSLRWAHCFGICLMAWERPGDAVVAGRARAARQRR
jgi:hypothetical protein